MLSPPTHTTHIQSPRPFLSLTHAHTPPTHLFVLLFFLLLPRVCLAPCATRGHRATLTIPLPPLPGCGSSRPLRIGRDQLCASSSYHSTAAPPQLLLPPPLIHRRVTAWWQPSPSYLSCHAHVDHCTVWLCQCEWIMVWGRTPACAHDSCGGVKMMGVCIAVTSASNEPPHPAVCSVCDDTSTC